MNTPKYSGLRRPPLLQSPMKDKDSEEEQLITSDEEDEIHVDDIGDLPKVRQKKTTKPDQSPRNVRRGCDGSSRQQETQTKHLVTKSSPVTTLPTPSSTTQFLRKWFLVILTFLVLIGAVYFGVYRRSPTSTEPSVPVSEIFLKTFESFPERFPSQRSDTWKKIRTVVKATASFKEPAYPGIIVLLSRSDTEKVANCLGRMLAHNLTLAYNEPDYVILRGKQFQHKDPDDAKMVIDNIIQTGLVNGKHVVLFDGLHYLPAQSSLLFHSYCDNENAPFKGAIYIFTVTMQEFAENEKDNEVTSVWKGNLSDDQRFALESRINSYVVYVNSEVKDLPKECS